MSDVALLQALSHYEREASKTALAVPLAQAVAESLICCGCFYPKDIGDRYLVRYHHGVFNECSDPAIAASCLNLDNSVGWSSSGILLAEGPAAVFRALVLGSFFCEDPEIAAWNARTEVGITHVSLEARESAALIAVITSLLCMKQDPDEFMLRTVLNWVRPSEVRRRLQDRFLCTEKATRCVDIAATAVLLLCSGCTTESIKSQYGSSVFILFQTLSSIFRRPAFKTDSEDQWLLTRLDREIKGPRTSAAWFL